MSNIATSLLPTHPHSYVLNPPRQGWTKPYPSDQYDAKLLNSALPMTMPGQWNELKGAVLTNNNSLSSFFNLDYSWKPPLAPRRGREMLILLDQSGDPTGNLMYQQRNMESRTTVLSAPCCDNCFRARWSTKWTLPTASLPRDKDYSCLLIAEQTLLMIVSKSFSKPRVMSLTALRLVSVFSETEIEVPYVLHSECGVFWTLASPMLWSEWAYSWSANTNTATIHSKHQKAFLYM